MGSVPVRFGDGASQQLSQVVAQLGCQRLLVVTDAGVRGTGAVDHSIKELRNTGSEAFVFDGVEENPTTAHVDAATRFARDLDVDGIVGFGGGSPMDVAKGVNFVLTNGGRIGDYWGYGKAKLPMLPSVGIPTTAGTGSEAQSFALIAQADTHNKMACGDPKARFTEVILDPALLVTVPRQVALATAMDALSHAVESHVSSARNPISQTYSREAWLLLARSFGVVAEGRVASDPQARNRLLLGAHLAGAAIECSMLGAAHACANPLTARYNITHGLAVGMMLPHVVRYNEAVAADGYDDLLERAPVQNATSLADALENLWGSTGVDLRLRDHGVEAAALPALAAEAATQWTARHNPREVAEDDLLELYQHAY